MFDRKTMIGRVLGCPRDMHLDKNAHISAADQTLNNNMAQLGRPGPVDPAARLARLRHRGVHEGIPLGATLGGVLPGIPGEIPQGNSPGGSPMGVPPRGPPSGFPQGVPLGDTLGSPGGSFWMSPLVGSTWGSPKGAAQDFCLVGGLAKGARQGSCLVGGIARLPCWAPSAPAHPFTKPVTSNRQNWATSLTLPIWVT